MLHQLRERIQELEQANNDLIGRNQELTLDLQMQERITDFNLDDSRHQINSLFLEVERLRKFIEFEVQGKGDATFNRQKKVIASLLEQNQMLHQQLSKAQARISLSESLRSELQTKLDALTKPIAIEPEKIKLNNKSELTDSPVINHFFKKKAEKLQSSALLENNPFHVLSTISHR